MKNDFRQAELGELVGELVAQGCSVLPSGNVTFRGIFVGYAGWQATLLTGTAHQLGGDGAEIVEAGRVSEMLELAHAVCRNPLRELFCEALLGSGAGAMYTHSGFVFYEHEQGEAAVSVRIPALSSRLVLVTAVTDAGVARESFPFTVRGFREAEAWLEGVKRGE